MSDSTLADDRALSVLVVDDEHDVADSLADLLALRGYKTRVAYGGAEAIQVASAFRPDVVFTDLAMPHMDGFSLARWLRAQVPHSVLVALTGLTEPEIEAECSAAGFDQLLLKPLNMNALAEVLQRAGARRTCSCAWASIV